MAAEAANWPERSWAVAAVAVVVAAAAAVAAATTPQSPWNVVLTPPERRSPSEAALRGSFSAASTDGADSRFVPLPLQEIFFISWRIFDCRYHSSFTIRIRDTNSILNVFIFFWTPRISYLQTVPHNYSYPQFIFTSENILALRRIYFIIKKLPMNYIALDLMLNGFTSHSWTQLIQSNKMTKVRLIHNYTFKWLRDLI